MGAGKGKSVLRNVRRVTWPPEGKSGLVGAGVRDALR